MGQDKSDGILYRKIQNVSQSYVSAQIWQMYPVYNINHSTYPLNRITYIHFENGEQLAMLFLISSCNAFSVPLHKGVYVVNTLTWSIGIDFEFKFSISPPK